MGFTTDFVGHIDIDPRLNAAEIEYLEAFRHSRHFDRPGGSYEVAGNPWAEEPDDVGLDRYNRPAPGRPQLYCRWSVCGEGCCLAWDGAEKFYEPTAWLEYLIDHFLRPLALAARSGDPQFRDFTFDHRLDGMVVGCRRDTRELYAIVVTGNRIRKEVLRPGRGEYADLPPLAYEDANDFWSERLERRGDRRRRLRAVPQQRTSGD